MLPAQVVSVPAGSHLQGPAQQICISLARRRALGQRSVARAAGKAGSDANGPADKLPVVQPSFVIPPPSRGSQYSEPPPFSYAGGSGGRGEHNNIAIGCMPAQPLKGVMMMRMLRGD